MERGRRDNLKCMKEGVIRVLRGMLETGVVDDANVVDQLLGSGHENFNLLTFDGEHPPSILYTLQDVLLSPRLKSRSLEVVTRMSGHYEGLGDSCLLFEWPGVDADFDKRIDTEFSSIGSSISSNHLVDSIAEDERGYAKCVFRENGKEIEAIRLKAFLILLRRQLRLESDTLAREELLSRLKGRWLEIFNTLPRLRRQEGGDGTRSVLFGCFLAALLEVLTPEELVGTLSDGSTTFFMKWEDSDPESCSKLRSAAGRIGAPSTTSGLIGHSTILADNHSHPTEKSITLQSLEDDLGIKLLNCQETEILPPEKLTLMNNKDSEKKTLLMKAAEAGSPQCVDLLLRCGAEVNACDGRERRAIDFASLGKRNDHSEVMLLLLQRDSLLPAAANDWGQDSGFHKKIQENVELREFFTKRDEFHEMLKRNDVEAIEDILGKSGQSPLIPKYWVNREGKSALYVAGSGKKYDAWALLRTNQFQYKVAEEEEMKKIERFYQTEFNHALEKYFFTHPECHVYKMVSRSKVVGDATGSSQTLLDMYREVDREPMTSLLLKCLQDEPHFEVIMDERRNDIRCMYVSSSDGVPGLMDPVSDRVYASGRVTEDYHHSDVVSNLVHELAHKAMRVVFANGGLPYRKGDYEKEKEYKKIVATVISSNNVGKCDKIIQRVKNYNRNSYDYELIVRVPEMVSKYHVEKNERSGQHRLQTEAADLLEYYIRYVEAEMKTHIESNQRKNKMPTGNLMAFPELLSDYILDYIAVGENMRKISFKPRHNNLRVIRASNIKLAVSHLKTILEHPVFVDWTRYKIIEEYFQTRLQRGYFSNVVVILDKSVDARLCSQSKRCDDSCSASPFEDHHKFVTLIIPKTIDAPLEIESVEYAWSDLSPKTKKYLLGKMLKFQGKKTKLRKLVESVDQDSNESTMATLIDSDDLSVLIDQDNLTVGWSLEETLSTRSHELLRNQPRNFIPRSMTLRPLELSKETIDWRKSDAFFINGTEVSNVVQVSVWNGGEKTVKTRCILINGEWNDEKNADDARKEIIETLRQMPCPGNDGAPWQFAHFFMAGSEPKKYVHLHSECINANQASILSDSPGSGKSVAVYMRAIKRKEEFPDQWVEVLELTTRGKRIKEWNERDFDIEDGVENILFYLIKDIDATMGKHYNFEMKLFKMFCRHEGKLLVFFDGFDEICPDYKIKVTAFLEALLQKTKVFFFVTTRPHECGDLETRLSTLAYNLVPFDGSEQVKFFNSQWNASLQVLPQEERKTKVKSIISAMQSLFHSDGVKETDEVIKSLQRITQEDKCPTAIEIKWDRLAEKVMAFGKSMSEGEGNLTEMPLYAWMLSSVTFDNNFDFAISLSLAKLYHKFVEININAYSEEKAKLGENLAAKCMREDFQSSLYEHLKKFSATVLISAKDEKLKARKKQYLLRTGFVVDRGSSTVFVHRAFAEYLFSTWILEHEMTENDMKRVFLDDEFERVRQFLGSKLLWMREKNSPGNDDIDICFGETLFQSSTFSSAEKYVEFLQRSLFTSILECNEGVLQYILESSEESLSDVIFGKVGWDVLRLGVKSNWFSGSKDWNAYSFCGQCIGGGIHIKKTGVTHSEVKYLKSLTIMLGFTLKKNLTENLLEFISTKGLDWMGINLKILWQQTEGISHFKTFFELLGQRRETLGETIKRKIFEEVNSGLFDHSSIHSLDTLDYILETFWEKKYFPSIITEEKNFLRAWNNIVKHHGVDEVRRIWSYFQGYLTRNDRKRLLQKKIGVDVNFLSAASSNKVDPDVLPFVWELYETELEKNECEDSLEATVCNLSQRSNWFCKNVFFKLLSNLLKKQFFDSEYVVSLLLQMNKFRQIFLLGFALEDPPSAIYQLQNIILTLEKNFKEILQKMKDHYGCMAPWCFDDSDWMESDADFIAITERESNELLICIQSHPLLAGNNSDADGNLLHVMGRNKTKIHQTQLKAFLFLLDRQMKIEKETLDEMEFTKRIQTVWPQVYTSFPTILMKREQESEIERETRSFLIPYFFAVLSKFLAKGKIREMLLNGNKNNWTTFHTALHQKDGNARDLEAYLSMYDVARWSMGEDALWEVHGLEGGMTHQGKKDRKLYGKKIDWRRKTVLQMLQKNQEEEDIQNLSV